MNIRSWKPSEEDKLKSLKKASLFGFGPGVSDVEF